MRVVPALRRIAVPVLVLHGSCDYLAPEVAREYADLLPNAVFRAIDGSGHAIAHDRPGEYRELVTAFLRGQRYVSPATQRPQASDANPQIRHGPVVRRPSRKVTRRGRPAV